MQDTKLMSNRLQFDIIDQETMATLRESRPLILEELPKILDMFYTHVPKFSETAKFFHDREHMKMAKQSQMRHWGLIADGRFDEAYAASVTKIGEVHYKLGLEPRWYIGGYSILVSSLVEAVAMRMLDKSKRSSTIAQCLRVQKAIIKAAMLDMDLAISVYNEAAARQREGTMEQAIHLQSEVGGVVQAIQTTAAELSRTAHVLTSSANATTERSNTVANGAEQASGNVRTVAAAAEELSASVKEISRYTSSSNSISTQAVEIAAQAMSKVEQLAEAAKKIGVIVDLINGIAGQTNLLALNATIEAARAGEAGRGFAVVAAEVKALAEQTAKATSEIGRQIGDIQTSTADSVAAINKISDTIKSMTEIATTIAGAVEEQGMATEEIARNVHEAAQGTNDVSTNIVGVSKSAQDTSSTAEKVLTSADTLGRYANDLRCAADRFLKTLRAA